MLTCSGLMRKLDPIILEKMFLPPDSKLWHCKICPFKKVPRAVMVEHVEINHIKHKGYNCELCKKTYQSRGTLHTHKYQQHLIL